MVNSPARTTALATALLLACAMAAAVPHGATAVGAPDEAVPLNACARPENGDPVVEAVEVRPSVVDVTEDEAVVELVAAVTDTGGPGPASGVREVRLGLGFGGSAVAALPLSENGDGGAPAQLEQDGLWHATLTVPEGAPAGTWHTVVHAVDRLGFRHDPWEESATVPATVHVSSGTRTASRLTGLRLDTSVDTTRSQRAVPVTVLLRAGVPETAHVRLAAYGSSPPRGARVELQLATRGGGTERWTGLLRIPRWAGDQRLRLHLVTVDRLGRYSIHRPRALARAGLPSYISVASGTDPGPPKVTFLRIAPRHLDLTAEDGRMVVRVRVRDAGSGVGKVTARLGPGDNGPPGELRLRRVSGSQHDGIWSGTLHVDRCLPYPVAGSVRVSAFDRAGRTARMHSSRQGLTVSVRWPDALARTPSSSPDGLSLRFPEDVVGVHGGSAVLLVGKERQVVVGTWTCRDLVGTEVDCVRGPVRQAVLQVSDSSALPGDRVVRLNPEHTLDLRDLAGNPYYRFDVRPGL